MNCWQATGSLSQAQKEKALVKQSRFPHELVSKIWELIAKTSRWTGRESKGTEKDPLTRPHAKLQSPASESPASKRR